jgi:hypothetical protein
MNVESENEFIIKKLNKKRNLLKKMTKTQHIFVVSFVLLLCSVSLAACYRSKTKQSNYIPEVMLEQMVDQDWYTPTPCDASNLRVGQSNPYQTQLDEFQTKASLSNESFGLRLGEAVQLKDTFNSLRSKAAQGTLLGYENRVIPQAVNIPEVKNNVVLECTALRWAAVLSSYTVSELKANLSLQTSGDSLRKTLNVGEFVAIFDNTQYPSISHYLSTFMNPQINLRTSEISSYAKKFISSTNAYISIERESFMLWASTTEIGCSFVTAIQREGGNSTDDPSLEVTYFVCHSSGVPDSASPAPKALSVNQSIFQMAAQGVPITSYQCNEFYAQIPGYGVRADNKLCVKGTPTAIKEGSMKEIQSFESQSEASFQVNQYGPTIGSFYLENGLQNTETNGQHGSWGSFGVNVENAETDSQTKPVEQTQMSGSFGGKSEEEKSTDTQATDQLLPAVAPQETETPTTEDDLLTTTSSIDAQTYQSSSTTSGSFGIDFQAPEPGWDESNGGQVPAEPVPASPTSVEPSFIDSNGPRTDSGDLTVPSLVSGIPMAGADVGSYKGGTGSDQGRR